MALAYGLTWLGSIALGLFCREAVAPGVLFRALLIGPAYTIWAPLLVTGAMAFGARHRRDWTAVGVGCAAIASWTWVGWWMCRALRA